VICEAEKREEEKRREEERRERKTMYLKKKYHIEENMKYIKYLKEEMYMYHGKVSKYIMWRGNEMAEKSGLYAYRRRVSASL